VHQYPRPRIEIADVPEGITDMPGISGYFADLFLISVLCKLSFETRCFHGANHAKDRTFPPRAVVFPETPGNPGIPVGIPAINLILIIQVQGG
jgi:hypothetical protein